MAKPKLSTKTPDDAGTNALIDAHADLIAHFNARGQTNSHIAIIEFGVTKVETFEGGGRQATYAIRQIELMEGTDRDAADKLFTRVYSQRTGEKSRPQPEAPQTELEGLDDSIDDSVE